MLQPEYWKPLVKHTDTGIRICIPPQTAIQQEGSNQNLKDGEIPPSENLITSNNSDKIMTEANEETGNFKSINIEILNVP